MQQQQLHLVLNRLIQRQRNESNSNDLSLKTLESKLNLTNDLLKNKDENSYISIESTDAMINTRYHHSFTLSKTNSFNKYSYT